uniref:Uncharacterized protein n=1 Tax=viral metagenome TaxID=1070528 RepID=A0A6M3LEG6_9ZZZZ
MMEKKWHIMIDGITTHFTQPDGFEVKCKKCLSQECFVTIVECGKIMIKCQDCLNSERILGKRKER